MTWSPSAEYPIQKEYGIDIIGEKEDHQDSLKRSVGALLGLSSNSLFNSIKPQPWGQIDSADYHRFLKFDKILNHPGALLAFVNEYSSLYSRVASKVLNQYFDDNNYYPLIGQPTDLDWYDRSRKQGRAVGPDASNVSIVNLVINKMPVPGPDVSWEQLTEFKEDPDTKAKNLALRSWIADISKKELSPSEVNDKLEGLLEDYTVQMKHHKMKYDVGQFEIILTTTLEILENLVKLKPSKVAKTLFDLYHGRNDLFEAEAKFPGREVAYLYKTQQFL